MDLHAGCGSAGAWRRQKGRKNVEEQAYGGPVGRIIAVLGKRAYLLAEY